MCNYYNVLSLFATELTRALSILKELLSQAETDLSEVDDDILEPLENTVDTLSSPLFNTLVDIQHKYEVVSNVVGVVCHISSTHFRHFSTINNQIQHDIKMKHHQLLNLRIYIQSILLITTHPL